MNWAFGTAADSLRPKHVEALVECWISEGIATGTVKDRMSAMRWWAEKVGKQNVVLRSNRDYGIKDRVFVSQVSKAASFEATALSKVTDLYPTMSLKLQAAFGRREESIKILRAWADCGKFLRLKDAWTKGGKYREVPIVNAEQRSVLDAAVALANGASLIPQSMRYRDQLQRFRTQCDKAGIRGVLGQRPVCAGSVRNAHRMGQSGRWRPCSGSADPSAEGGGQSRTADHFS